MPIAAVPEYLGSDFKSASPGLCFGMYLPIWTERTDQEREVKERATKRSREGGELKRILGSPQGMDGAIKNLVRREKLPDLWDKNDSGSRDSWKKVVELTNDDYTRMKALAEREAALFQTMTGASGLRLMAKSVAPFTTGLGNEHPLENGFAFLNPYGLPYLPGSGVKGVVRRAAEELAHQGFFRDDSGWTLPAIWHLFGFEPWLVSKGRESDAGWRDWIGGFSVRSTEIRMYLDAVLDDVPFSQKLKCRVLKADDPLRKLLQERQLHVRGAIEFWDVIPRIKANRLSVEIMTPHHSHYYQGKAQVGSTSPHDSGQPVPISFLTVPPGSGFVFHVRCNQGRLSRRAPKLAENGRWRVLLEAAFEHAFEWLGFGAKTAVGYGAMDRNREGEQRTRQERQNRERETRERAERERAEREAEASEQERLVALSPLEREIESVIRDRKEKSMSGVSAVIQAARGDRWTGAEKVEVARWLEKKLKEQKTWKETSGKRNVLKDKAYQNTLLVQKWLEGSDA